MGSKSEKNGVESSSTEIIMMETEDDSAHFNSLDIEINNQTILFSIKLLCKRIGEQNPLAFVRVIKFLSENLIDKSLYIKDGDKIHNSNLLSSVLLCIGEVCLKLKSNAIPYLNQTMIFALEIVDILRSKLGDNEDSDDLISDFDAKASKQENAKLIATFKSFELLMISCVTCLLKIVQNLANFLSPYLPRLFYVSCTLSYLAAKNQRLLQANESSDSDAVSKPTSSSSSLSQIDFKLSQLRSTLATLVPLRLLTPIFNEQSLAICSSISETSKKSVNASYKMKIKHVEYYMQISRLAVQNANQEDLLANIKMLRSMFLNLFEMRTFYVKVNRNVLASGQKSATKKVSLEDFITNELTKYENHVIYAFCEMTFKLSEDLFKPLFFRMYEWATVNNPPKDRQITFYKSTLKLSDKLKNLFVLFASQFIQNASDLLNQLNASKTSKASSFNSIQK